MPSNYQSTICDADIVFCIDCTGSMRPTLDMVKQNALNLYDNLKSAMLKKDKELGTVRVKVIAFRDYLESMKDGNAPMLTTDFFSLPQEQSRFHDAVCGLQPVGGGDDPEDALEALGFAIKSKWRTSTEGRSCRNIIVLWTDSAPHELGYGKRCPGYPEKMARDLAELTAWWGDGGQDNGFMPALRQRRLLLFAPEVGAWNQITNNWNLVIQYTTALGKGVEEHDYDEILTTLVQSISV